MNRAKPEIPDHQMLARIGGGSSGEVWSARNVLGTLRAVKIVHRRNFEETASFEREFKGLKSYEPVSRPHEALVDIFQVGRTQGYFYYVMELADEAPMDDVQEDGQAVSTKSGQRITASPPAAGYRPRTLRSDLIHRNRLPVAECLQIGLRLSSALGHLHQQGLVHRDIKPSNIIFVGGQPKLADVGLVTETAEARSFVGTIGYIPPEGPGTVQADLYSLGKVLYEIGTGCKIHDFPRLPPDLHHFPDHEDLVELNEVILKACDENPKHRYRSAEDLEQHLLRVQGGKSIRRIRWLEKRLTLARTLAAITAMAVVLGAVGMYHAWKTRTLTQSNFARAQVSIGADLLEQEDLYGALLHFAAALRADPERGSSEEAHQTRMASVLQLCAKPITLLGHGDAPAKQLFVAPNGTQLATLGEDLNVRLGDAETGIPTHELLHQNEVVGVEFSGDGTRLLTTTWDGYSHLWDTGSGEKLLLPVRRHQSPLVRGGYYLGLPEPAIVVTKTMAKLIRAPPLSEPCRDLTMKLTFTGHGSSVHLQAEVWKRADGKPLWADTFIDTADEDEVAEGIDSSPNFLGKEGYLTLILWDDSNPGDRFPSTAEFDNVRVILSDESGSTTNLLEDFEADISSGWAFYGKGTSSMHQTNGALQIISSPHPSYPLAYAVYATEGFTISPGRTLEFQVDLVRSDPDVWPFFGFAPRRAIRDELLMPSISLDGRRFLLGSGPATLRLIDATTGETLGTLEEESQIDHNSFTPDGTGILTVTEQRQMTLWDSDTGERQWVASVPGGNKSTAPRKLCSSSDGRIVATLNNARFVHLWDTGKQVHSLVHDQPVTSACLSHDARLLATGSTDQNVRLWDTAKGQLIGQPMSCKGPLVSVQFSPDGRLLLSSDGSVARVWDLHRGTLFCPPIKNVRAAPSDAFAAHGRVLCLLHNDGTIRIWDFSTVKRERVDLRPLSPRPALSPDGAWEAKIEGPNSFSLVETGSGDSIWTADLRTPIRQLYFDKRGEYLVTERIDTRAQVWQVGTGEPLSPLMASRYALDHTQSPKVLLPQDQRPVETSVQLAELLNGQSLKQGGVRRGIGFDQARRLWKSIAQEPEFRRPEKVLGWHDRMALESEQAWDWTAALYHLDFLLTQDPDQADWLRRRRYAAEALKAAEKKGLDFRRTRQVIPPRPFQAPAKMLDLSDCFNRSLKHDLDPQFLGSSLAALPSGIQLMAGIEFDVRGVCLLRGRYTQRQELKLPEKVGPVPVAGKCARLHFFHGAMGRTPMGRTLARYVIHYSDGQDHPIPAVCGRDIMGWHFEEGMLIRSRAELAWLGTSPGSQMLRRPLRLFKSTHPNPRPGVRIESIEFISANQESAPFLIAITLE